MYLDDEPGLLNPSLSLPEDHKFDAVIAFLTESHLDTVGGYPYDWCEIGKTVVVATLDPFKEHGATLIKTYKRRTLLRWYDAAVRDLDGSPGEDVIDALYATWPDEDK